MHLNTPHTKIKNQQKMTTKKTNEKIEHDTLRESYQSNRHMEKDILKFLLKKKKRQAMQNTQVKRKR